jgi:hypothetical protein
MRPERPMVIFIYQPLYLKGKNDKPKFMDCKTRKFPPARIEVGDVFTGEKRVAEFIQLKKRSTSIVASVTYNYADGTCGVILEDKVFETKEDMDKYLSNTAS